MTQNGLMIVLTKGANINNWMQYALRLLPKGGEIHLRGLVTIEADKSLSEGALPTRELREALNEVAKEHDEINDEVQVYVNYQPFVSVLEELSAKNITHLLVEWGALDEQIGGMSFNEVMKLAPCNVVLVSGIERMRPDQNVLLALRGGPNLTVGTEVAQALTGDGMITLFHAIDRQHATPDLEVVMRNVPQIKRMVSQVSGIVDGIVREATSHDVVVMGTGVRRNDKVTQETQAISRQVSQRSDVPMVLVRGAREEAMEFHAPRLPKVDEGISDRVDRWFAENTFHSNEFSDIRALMALKEKQGVTISIALPALNEEGTVGKVIATLKGALMDEYPLVDEIVLIDSDSTDNTRKIAEDCGVPVQIHQQILPDEVGTYRGKGEALWKSLYVTKGDIIAWVDTDITNIHPRFIYGLIGPLLKQQRVQYVKGFYARPIKLGGKFQAYGGGRVTELVARPLFNLFYPELSGIVQPLSGEYAGRRSTLEQLPFFTGYGVETGLLIDVLDRFGLDAIAQSDLEVRVHHNQPLVNLSKMSFAILQVFISRMESRYGMQLLDKAHRSMKLVIQEPERFALDIAEIGDNERPPMASISSYREVRGLAN